MLFGSENKLVRPIWVLKLGSMSSLQAPASTESEQQQGPVLNFVA